MKQKYAILFLLITLILPIQALAQNNEANAIQSLAIDLWPDFDQESVLVLITGVLPADAALPATVSIPFPADATINAVARISIDNSMFDDVQYDISEGILTFTTPDPRFRIEYYMPYDVTGNDRTFTFSWVSDAAVDQIEISVQQPSGASSLETIPPADSVSVGQQDGLTYHVLPRIALSARIPYEITVSYKMAIPQLTNTSAQPAQSETTAVTAPPSTPQSGTNWPLILGIFGGVFVVAAIAWQFAGGNKSSRPQKPAPRRTSTTKARPRPQAKPQSQARFCRECGSALKSNDKFCSECGTAVKNT
ncbi:MAG: zinc ribbon domain-containing protein [Chloroflexi bacterium]|nr:zinc ribbon domain-containing protein [Chloroflexota bacterium]